MVTCPVVSVSDFLGSPYATFGGVTETLQFGQWERLIVSLTCINHHLHLHHLDISASPLRS
jgi:hypothetical protein